MKRIRPIFILIILWFGTNTVVLAQQQLTLDEIYEQEIHIQHDNILSAQKTNQVIQSVQQGDLNNIHTIQQGMDNSILSMQNGDENYIQVVQQGYGNTTNVMQKGSEIYLNAYQDGSENSIYLQQTGNSLWATIAQKGIGNSVGAKDAPLTQDVTSMMLLDIKINQDGYANSVQLGEISSTIPKGIEISQYGNDLKLDIAHFTLPMPLY
ncbi:hypothetical protein EMN47_10380 [Prolixibacteraceae bacterium JC049]|nr:hypothetical protein [Prolixibacteraceae bacterium JC049]